MNKYQEVLSPFTLRGKTFKNRVEFSPFVANKAGIYGECTQETVDFIEWQAKTGVAYITIGDTIVDYKYGNNFAGEIRVDDDRYKAGLYRLAEVAHKNGAYLSIELSHSGAGANPMINDHQALSPSGTPLNAPFTSENPKMMTREDMDYVKKRWVECSKRCVDAGFDMIMIHAAHQCMIGQWLSPKTNKRQDEYGGSLENRMRYPLEIIQAIREAVGEKVILEMRVSSREEVEGGMEEDETIEFCKAAQKYIDIVNVSRGSIYDPIGSTYTMPNYMKPQMFNVELAEKFKKNLDILVAVPGNIYTMEAANEIIKSGKADIVSMAHDLLADPMMIKNAMKDQTYLTRPCLRCQECAQNIGTGLPIRCAVNPRLGLETELKYLLDAKEKKKVVVIGGGVAGMQVTQTCCQRGHEVVLFEKSDRLGGMLHDASTISSKKLMRNYLAWDIQQTLNSNAKVYLNTEATLDLIRHENPDEVFVCTGSVYKNPSIKGIELPSVVSVSDVDNNRVQLKNRIIVCGSGATGIECAVDLASKGKEVTIIDMLKKEDMINSINRAAQQELIGIRFPRYHIQMLDQCKILEFKEHAVVVETPSGIKELEMDQAVIALGVQSYNPLGKEIQEAYPLCSHFIGDCHEVGNIRKANMMAFYEAIQI